jgi:Terminase small subunit
MAKPRPAPNQLNETELTFAHEYLANGRNATQAYLRIKPKASSRTAQTQGSKLLSRSMVRAFVDTELQRMWKEQIMSGSEALALISAKARFNPQRLFKDNKLLPISEWAPDDALCVKKLKPTQHGTAVELYDGLKASELMAINAGHLRQGIDHAHTFKHVEYLGAEPPKGDDE